MKQPLVSVLMPAYNAERYVEKAITSIIDQTYSNFELLIIDDGSADQTRLIVDKFSKKNKKIKFSQNEYNIGYLKTCNKLFSMAQGDLITFQDADDWSHPQRLALQVEAFIKSPSLGICGTFAQYIDHNQKIVKEKKPRVHDADIKEHIRFSSQFCGASIMVTRSVLNRVGGYREYFDRIANEDYDWSSRIVEKFPACNIPEFLYFIYQSPNSISRNVRDPRQLISKDLVVYLINQRRKNSFDTLEINNQEALVEFERELLLPYNKDRSLIYRKNADIQWYNGNTNQYVYSTFLALRSNLFKIINWKYFIVAIYRKSQIYVKNIISR